MHDMLESYLVLRKIITVKKDRTFGFVVVVYLYIG